jgi:hypothetical protein
LQQKIAAIASLGATFTAFAKHDSKIWPFVTLNDFQQRAASTRSLSGAYSLQLLPFVSDRDRAGWESYSVANKGWLDEGRAYQAKNSQRFEEGDDGTGFS